MYCINRLFHSQLWYFNISNRFALLTKFVKSRTNADGTPIYTNRFHRFQMYNLSNWVSRVLLHPVYLKRNYNYTRKKRTLYQSPFRCNFLRKNFLVFSNLTTKKKKKKEKERERRMRDISIEWVNLSLVMMRY